MSWPDLPDGWTLDPDCEQPPRERGWCWVILPDGTRTAWNERNHPCPICQGQSEKMIDCTECKGRGMVDSIPYCERPWDLIAESDETGGQLWLGGIHCQFGGVASGPGEPYKSVEGNAFPGDRFDVVLSMLHAPGYEPYGDTEHHEYRIADADLDPKHHSKLDYLAERVIQDYAAGKRIFIRCQAGINRSSLVMALALMKMGVPLDEVVANMRELRSPYVLFNRSFMEYLREVEAR